MPVSDPPVPVVVPPPARPAPDRPAKQPRLWPRLLAAGVLALGLAALWLFQPWASAVPLVAAEVVAPGPVARVLAVNGRIAAEASVEIRPLVGGSLMDLTVREGDSVSAGAVLARIDPAAQAAVVRQAMAGLDAALVAQTEAQATFERTQALGTTAARVALDAAARAVQSAGQEVARMTALLEQAQIQLARFTVASPIAGIVLNLPVDPGQTVDLSSVLMTIADLDTVMVQTDVDEAYATTIRAGQPAVLQLAGETEVRPGRVSFVSQRVDAATGGLSIKLAPEAPLVAPIGLTVTANITVDDRPAAITVPRAAIARDASGTAVFVIADGTARRRAVQVIDWPAARLIVTEGLATGESVIADATGITDGQAIKVAP